MGDEAVVDVASCLRYGYNYVVISIEDAVRLIDTANALEAIEVQVAIPPHVGAKDYETIVKLLARSKFTRMKVVNPRDPSQIRAIIHRVMETIMEKPKRIKLVVSSMVEVLNVEAMSGVQYHIAFPDSFPHQRQASIACVAYLRGFKVINGPFATPSPPARVTLFWGHLCKLIPKTDWTSLARITIRWMPLVVLLASGAYKGCTRRSKTETLEATSAAIDVTHNKETASWLIEEDSANYPEIKNVLFFGPIRIDEHSPEPLQDFRKFIEDFLMRYLKKIFSIDGSTLDEVVFKLFEDYDKFSEAPEFKKVKISNWDDVNYHDLKRYGRFFIDFAVVFVETAVEHLAKLSDKYSRKSYL